MAKDTHLVNIYLKIHNKRPLTMDDLRYLAEYAPECFEKTCRNVVYNRPETKPIMEPKFPKFGINPLHPISGIISSEASEDMTPDAVGNIPAAAEFPAVPTSPDATEPSEQQLIETVLENLMKLESDYLPIADINASEVKDLLGNLYMELLFPHNDTHSFFSMPVEEPVSRFDRKA